jgi:serine/threonine protein kinase
LRNSNAALLLGRTGVHEMKTCSACGTAYSGELCPRCLAGFARRSDDDEEFRTAAGCEVLGRLGRGAMGVVYKVRDPRDGRLYALKVLAGEDPWLRKRLAREGRALLALEHPNIVRVHSLGTELLDEMLRQAAPEPAPEVHAGDEPFSILMEFVDGPSLRERLAGGPLPAAEAVRLMLQVLDALDYAHRRGIVHRDVKPENILLDTAGVAKVADFGLAKILLPPPVAAAGGPARAREALSTAQSDYLGTPSYMAPEQRRNPKAVDARADLYSAGVVLHEMLTGFLPPARSVAAPLDTVVAKMLEEDRSRRYATAAAAKSDLEIARKSL